MSSPNIVEFPDNEERPFQRTDGSRLWDAVDENGYGHTLGFSTAREVEVWLMGYEKGARENM